MTQIAHSLGLSSKRFRRLYWRRSKGKWLWGIKTWHEDKIPSSATDKIYIFLQCIVDELKDSACKVPND